MDGGANMSQYIVKELPQTMSKHALMKENIIDGRKLDRLMHSDDAWKVGFFTDGGQFRFVITWLFDYLKEETKCRI